MTAESQTTETALTAARRRDVGKRYARVRQALADMHTDGSDITIASTAARANVHRSFIHRHSDLHTAVLTAAARLLEQPSPASTAISHRSLLTENANLHQATQRLSQRIKDLEDRLSEMLGQDVFIRSGLGAPTGTASLQNALEHERQTVMNLKTRIEELNEDLAAARETNRRLMSQVNRQ